MGVELLRRESNGYKDEVGVCPLDPESGLPERDRRRRLPVELKLELISFGGSHAPSSLLLIIVSWDTNRSL